MVKKEPQGFRPQTGDEIFCVHGGQKYLAKILDIRKDPEQEDKKNPDLQYRVHYKGWNKTWDEWVGPDRISQTDEKTLAEVSANQNSKKATRAKGVTSAKKKPPGTPNQANTSQSSIKSLPVDEIIPKPELIIDTGEEIKISIPTELKNWLIDDDNNIKNKKLTVLPAKPNIASILKDFVNHKKSTGKSQTDREVDLNELTSGIRDFFNVMLGHYLLYKFERLQYQQLLKDQGNGANLTQQYGVIHLVRLITKIGMLLSISTLESQNVQTIVNYIQDLLKYIAKQPALFDLEKNYIVAPPEYIKNAFK